MRRVWQSPLKFCSVPIISMWPRKHLFTKHLLFHIPVNCFPFPLKSQDPAPFSLVQDYMNFSFFLSLEPMSMDSLYICNYVYLFCPVNLSLVNWILRSPRGTLRDRENFFLFNSRIKVSLTSLFQAHEGARREIRRKFLLSHT